MAARANEKYDVKREHPELYAPSAKEFAIVDVPPMRYLAVDGHGDPNTAARYRDAVEALFGVAYAVKFASKRMLGRDFVVAPLEGLWWAEDQGAFVARDKGAWSWTLLIAQPDWIDEDAVAAAVDAVRAKSAKAGGRENPALDELRLEHLHEGPSAQILHVGSYDDEAPTLATAARRMDAAAGPHLQRPPPRGVPQRCPAHGAGEAAHRAASAGSPALTRHLRRLAKLDRSCVPAGHPLVNLSLPVTNRGAAASYG